MYGESWEWSDMSTLFGGGKSLVEEEEVGIGE